MTIAFSIAAWGGCAPGLDAPADWLAWAADAQLPAGEAVAPLAEMPPLLRRRLGDIGRAAVQSAYRCEAGKLGEAGAPHVFASRYGDAARSLAMTHGFSQNGEVSPTDFALSVHNAIGAVYSIAQRDRSNCIAVAGGAASAAAGIVEAAGLLADGASEVVLVCYDAPLPTPYSAFDDKPAATYAWTWRIAKPEPGQAHFELGFGPASGVDSTAGTLSRTLPFGLDAMRFMLSGDAFLRREADGIRWTWSRHA